MTSHLSRVIRITHQIHMIPIPIIQEVKISKLTPALKGVGLKLRDAQAKALYRDLDSNGDGKPSSRP